MKEYVIFLKSGQCLTGTVNNVEAKHVLEKFNDKHHSVHIKDEDGDVYLNMTDAVALALNDKPVVDPKSYIL